MLSQGNRAKRYRGQREGDERSEAPHPGEEKHRRKTHDARTRSPASCSRRTLPIAGAGTGTLNRLFILPPHAGHAPCR